MISAKEAETLFQKKIDLDNSLEHMAFTAFDRLIDSNVKLAIEKHRRHLNPHIHVDEVKYIDKMRQRLEDNGYKVTNIIEIDDNEDPDFPIGSKIIFMEF